MFVFKLQILDEYSSDKANLRYRVASVGAWIGNQMIKRSHFSHLYCRPVESRFTSSFFFVIYILINIFVKMLNSLIFIRKHPAMFRKAARARICDKLCIQAHKTTY